MAKRVREKQEESYYTSCMNKMYDLPWKRIGVCVLVASVVLVPVVGIAMAALMQQANDQCLGDQCFADRTVEPCIGDDCPAVPALAQRHFAPAIPTFPNWYHNQIIFDAAALAYVDLQRGNQIVSTAEVITEEFEDISSRQLATFSLLQQITQMPTDQKSQVVTGIFNSGSKRGLVLTLDTRAFTLGLDPKCVKNHHIALEFIEQNLLSKDDFTAEELEAHLISLHRIFAKDSQVKGGEYRDGIVALQGDNVGIELEEVVQVVRQKEPQSVYEFRRVYRKLFESHNREHALKSLTKEEKRIFSLAFDIDFPLPNEVSQKMKQFCRDYVAKLQAQIPTIEFASWIHDTLIGIHPWEDWNGHVSRALMNGELARKGHLPFLIFDDKKYNAAVRNKEFKDHLVMAQNKVQKLAERFNSEDPMKKALVKF
ncbi:Fic family protein [Simkania sp.]|uniref:Fic family protein n=1 Tax=Simkania sp. TaxID=34094 RepID=UPI003B515DB0